MATNTFIALDKVTVGTATPSITFSSISQGYTDLVLVCSSTDSVGIYARLGNGSVDSGTNYSYTYVLGDGSTATSGRNSNVTKGYLSLSSDVSAKQFHTITNFQNYSNTTTNKTFLTRYSDSTIYSAAVVNLWRSTSAINIISVYGDGGNIPAGSTFSLYGIKAEAVTPTGVTGGTLYSDATYYYNVFTASDNLTITSGTLKADVLMVAGGGGGGRAERSGAGGGAGGMYEIASQYIAAGTYAITVGAGGAAAANNSATGTKGTDSIFAGLTNAYGGGGGGGYNGPTTGGSGGGGSPWAIATSGAAGVSGQGNSGGSGNNDSSGYNGGGGGGKGGSGGSGTGVTGGAGGASSYSGGATTGAGQLSGGSYYFAGGGGGAKQLNGSIPSAASGGVGGGGAGSTCSFSTAGVNATNATANTGGGGGGGGGSSGLNMPAGSGGSGIVIVRYLK